MSDEKRFDVTIARRRSYAPWWAPAGKRFERLVASIPTHRDTRTGRRNALQIRAILLTVGIVTVVLWESDWAPLALVICVAAIIMPMPASKRRELVASLRAGRTGQTRVERTDGTLVLTDKHVTLTDGEDRVRRLRRSGLTLTRRDDGLLLKEGGKKKDRLLVTAPGAEPDDDVWAESDAVGEIRTELC